MFFGKKRRIVGLLLAACIGFTAEFETFAASPQSEAQVIEVVNYETQVSPMAVAWEQLGEVATLAADAQAWNGKALAYTDTEANIYTEMSESSKLAGKMYKNTVLTIVENGAEWTKVTSGTVTGYVRNELLLTGGAAVERAKTTCAEGTGVAEAYVEPVKAARVVRQPVAVEVNVESLLAALIYCEAGNQPYDGKVAVGAVVMNRVASGRFPNSIEEVIYQRGQFTPAMTGKLNRVLNSGKVPSSCYDAARDALNGVSPVGNALYFNTGYGSFKLGDHYFS
ncbi:MAG: cell wall hydrolase [Faecalimonas sp.]|nr:cell wall hydrolase [Faecalimonas sp.]